MRHGYIAYDGLEAQRLSLLSQGISLSNLYSDGGQRPSWRNSSLSKYGMDDADYAALLESQDGRCAICRSERTGTVGRFCVDHCHGCGIVRGLLCSPCNMGTHWDKVPNWGMRSTEYLNNHQHGVSHPLVVQWKEREIGQTFGWGVLGKTARPGDEIVVQSFDRLPGTPTSRLLLMEKLVWANIHVTSLDDGFSTSDGDGAVCNVIRVLAQWHRLDAKQRSMEGQQEARRRGKHIGRPAIPPAVRELVVLKFKQKPNQSWVSRETGVSRGSVQNVLKEAGLV